MIITTPSNDGDVEPCPSPTVEEAIQILSSAKQCGYIDRNNTRTAVAASFASFVLLIFYNDSEARKDTKARLRKSNPASGRLTDTSVWLG